MTAAAAAATVASCCCLSHAGNRSSVALVALAVSDSLSAPAPASPGFLLALSPQSGNSLCCAGMSPPPAPPPPAAVSIISLGRFVSQSESARLVSIERFACINFLGMLWLRLWLRLCLLLWLPPFVVWWWLPHLLAKGQNTHVKCQFCIDCNRQRCCR